MRNSRWRILRILYFLTNRTRLSNSNYHSHGLLLSLYRGVLTLLPEKTFENKIKKFLTDNGCWYVKFFANAFTPSGIPDLLCCVGGTFVAIEVKAENGKPSPLQLHKIEEIKHAGGVALVVKPSQFEELKKLLIQIKEKST